MMASTPPSIFVEDSVMNIAFIGLGNMGAPMARNLIKAGHSLNLFDLNQDILSELAAQGGHISASPKAAAQGAQLVITMLPAAAHVRSVWLGEEGVLAGIGEGVPAVDCSTIDPQTARDVAAAAAKHGVADGRCAGLRRHGRGAGRYADLYGRRHPGTVRYLATGAGADGPQHRALR
jgi:hypothetical protein